MNPDWQSFLTHNGAIIEAGIVQSFGDATAELNETAQGTVCCDLSRFGTIRISGEDAQSFLQNLLSNDIQQVSNNRAQLSSLNSAKGRMLASMLIWRDGEDYLIQLPRELCEPIRKKLSMYVLRSKVKVSDVSDEIVSLGVSGENAENILRKQFGELPRQSLGFINMQSGSIIQINDARFQINTTAQAAPTVWEALSQHTKPVGSDCWDWLNIHSGIPMILPQTQEQFVPQMVNLELIGGVNFKKGCYPGQEIVARMQYLGKLKRRMYLAHIDSSRLDSNTQPRPGDELFSDDMEGQPSGMLVNVAPSPAGGYDALAVVQISSREQQAVLWKSLQGAVLQFLPLPYSLQEN